MKNRSWKSVLRDRRPTVKETGSLWYSFLLKHSLLFEHTEIFSDVINNVGVLCLSLGPIVPSDNIIFAVLETFLCCMFTTFCLVN